MDSSEHSRNSSSDAGEHELKYRECDDMLARRLGNLPAPLRKKKTEDQYKRFITPTGDPMTYVRQHMRSQSMSDLQVESAEKDQERDDRNARYEEMQKLKQMLKEEEETWTSKLDNWKQRRRSATLDVRRRKEDRDTVEQQTAGSTRRRAKTYREIVEDKKRRESGLFDGDDHLSPRLDLPSDDDKPEAKKKTEKVRYRGAMSTPNIRNLNSDVTSPRSSSPSSTKVVVKPVKYTSKVTAVINHVPSESMDSSDLSKSDSSSPFENKSRDAETPQVKTIWPPPSEPSHQKQPTSSSRIAPVKYTPVSQPLSFSTSNPRSQSPPPSSYSSKATVVMRQKSPNTNKERPKSAYSALGDRASTLPRNYHAYSAPKPFDPTTSTFVQKRRTAFANKRNMWESMSHKDPETPRAAPVHLSSLLKHDTEKLYGSDHHDNDNRPIENGVNNSFDSQENEPLPKPANVSTSPKHDPASVPTEHKPKIMGNHIGNEGNVRPWQRGQTNNQTFTQPAYRRVNAPAARAAWSRSATLPTQMRAPSFEAKVEPVQSYHEETTPPTRVSAPQGGNSLSVAKSPRSQSTSGSEPLFDDMKICINQRPKSEKGFGFTVRGGDEGRPVIVNTVSPGGAADICQLCVGDEILAINDVRLSSSLTQDGIVQLIVDSVITGNLSLDIRRYGKSKKANPMRLTGTKVVMTSGGFVQVRSDKGKSPVVSTKMFNGSSSNNVNKEQPLNNHNSMQDFPLPLPPEDLAPAKKLSAMGRLSPQKRSPTVQRKSTPLSNLINAAKSTSSTTPQGKENYNNDVSSDMNDYNNSFVDDLHMEVSKAQRDLEIEESYLNAERRQHEENVQLRKQLMEEQRMIEEKEAKREEEKRKRIEEAKLEEQKLEEELRRIEAAKLEQQKKREEEKRWLIEQPAAGPRMTPLFDQGGGGGMNHWLIEEAERRRLADEEGRHRNNPLDYNRDDSDTSGSLPDHVIQRLSQRNQPQRGSQSGNQHLPGSLTNYWNDPSTQATLL